MKGIIYLAMALFFTTFVGCKKDIGNYEYTDTPVVQIDTTGLGNTYRLLRLTPLKIAPDIRIPEGHQGTYKWLIYEKQSSNNASTSSKEISDKPVLDVVIVEPVGEYVTELIVTDATTGLTSNVTFNVSVTANMEFGMMVLYQGAQGGDIDFIRTPALSSTIDANSHIKNMYSLSTGKPISGQAKFIWSSFQAFQITNWITVGSDNYIARFKGDDFTFIRDQEDMYRRRETVINPQAYVFNANSLHVLINGKKLHATGNGFYESDIKFPGPADGDYELAPYLVSRHASSYSSIAYDQKNSRFVRYYLSTNRVDNFAAAAAGQVFDLRNIGKDMLYMTNGASNYTYAFFKEKTGTGRWLYVVDFTKSSDAGNLAVGAYNMTDLPDAAQAKFYQVSGFGGYAYYATTDKIYNYAYRNANTASIAFQMPAGEEITCMRYYKPVPNISVADKEERVLYVATWNGTRAKVYELAINETSGVINPTPLNVFEVAGKVVDMAARATL